VPEPLILAAGDIVAVPLGRRQVVGMVWGPGEGQVAAAKLKDVRARLDVPPLPLAARQFVDWVAGYTLNPPGAVLKMMLSVPEALTPPKPTIAYGPSPTPPVITMTAARERVLALVVCGLPRTAAELAREAAVSPSVIKALADAGTIVPIPLPAVPPPETPEWRRPGPALSADQAAAATVLTDTTARGGFSVTLLDGVPGSGKTEVYFQTIAETLKRGRQALVLLPEIALSAQWLQRFRARFAAAPAVWHSDLSGRERRATWRAVADGQARVVVGARSALFLPFADLGLIVVDEEHDASYKQEDGPIYHARDMAVVRARLGDIPAVLVSATPSLETVVNVESGRYAGLHLPDRHAGALLPEVRVIDMRATKLDSGAWLSPTLKEMLAKTLAEGEQAMLFLNRRGYAPLTLCRACGHRLQCPRCTAWLVEHRGPSGAPRLQCHHCGFASARPKQCPACAAEDRFAACGPGVERLAEEIERAFPGVRHVIAASDTIAGPKAAADIVRRIEDHEVDLVIGTQIVAKGYHFPLLTLVGVVDADLGLAGGDLRAAERTYQLLYQVAGRAGRADRPGRVLLQTYMPQHPVMAALTAGDRERFLAAEKEARRQAGMPPFGRLVALIVSGEDEARVERIARALARTAPKAPGVTVLGPAPAPFALLRGRHRRRLLLKATRDVNVQAIVREWLRKAPSTGRVRVQIDVDPYSFL
jgi:primosomal protein N' (replication factor Y)